jgi:hypothetical protein
MVRYWFSALTLVMVRCWFSVWALVMVCCWFSVRTPVMVRCLFSVWTLVMVRCWFSVGTLVMIPCWFSASLPQMLALSLRLIQSTTSELFLLQPLYLHYVPVNLVAPSFIMSICPFHTISGTKS